MKMTLPLYVNIIYLMTLEVVTSDEQDCKKILFDGTYYKKKVLHKIQGRTYNLNIHQATNTLFFSSFPPDAADDVSFVISYLFIDSKTAGNIDELDGGFSIAIDQINDEVYLGGSDGIYKYNLVTKTVNRYKEKGKNIWAVYFYKKMFYISYPDQKLFIEIDGIFSLVREFKDIEVDIFHVTNNNVIYFANKTGYYNFNKEGAQLISDYITVRQIVEDKEKNVYVVTTSGVYTQRQAGLKKVIDLRNIYGIAFDRYNNMIYSDDGSINILEFSNHVRDSG